MIPPVWANINIKGKIRSLLRRSILSLLLVLALHLKDKIAHPAIASPAILLVAAGGNQVGLENYTSKGRNSSQSSSGPEINDGAEDNSADAGHVAKDEKTQGENGEDDLPVGLIYARVSSDKQRKEKTENNDEDGKDNGILDEGSIEGQVEELEQIAENEGIELPYDPIVDAAKSGTNFDRDGIQEVFEKAKRDDIDYLLVEKVDRIGRSAAETLYFIYILQSECGVTLLTSSGTQDVSKTHGLMQTTLMSLMADIQNELRTSKANKERIRGFLEKKNWKCYSPIIPLGYNETEDGWLTVNPDEKEIVRDIFKKFVACENYAETERYIDNMYGSDILEGHSVKTILQNSVYIGEPRLPESWLEDTMYENDLEEPELRLLRKDGEEDASEEVFHQAQAIIEEKEQQYADDDSMDLLDFIEEFSLFAVVQGSEPATLLHHCGEPLIKDGQADLKGGFTGHRYRCRNCEESEDSKEYYRQWPKESELDTIKLIQKVLDDDEPDFLAAE